MLPEGLDEAVGDGVALGDGECEEDGEGDEDGEGEEDGEGDEEGEGEEPADEGTAWHTVLAVAARGAACALPRTPRERKLPLSTVTAAALTCAKRIRIACLCCSSGKPCAVRDSETRADRMATFSNNNLPSYIRITSPTVHSPPAGPVSAAPFGASPLVWDGLRGGLVPRGASWAIPGQCYPGSFFPYLSFRTLTRP